MQIPNCISPLMAIIAAVSLAACGKGESEPEKATSGHVWKSQTDSIQHAKDTGADLEKTLQHRTQQINQ